MDLHDLRQQYAGRSIDVDSVDPCPIKQFESWFKDATSADVLEPNAMVVSTVDGEGRPTQRTVLLKYFDESGFLFFTNYHSRKGTHIAANQHVSLLFPWYVLQRQVEVNGVAEKVSTAESLKYFARRPRGSQLGAWVSEQSSVVSTRGILQNKLSEITRKFSSGDVPKPTFWGGYRVKPYRVEFWQGGKNRLHDRVEYQPVPGKNEWQRQRLFP